MSGMNLIFHLPPVWLPESKTLALEVNAEGTMVVCLIPSEELHHRYRTQLDLDADEAQVVFATFRGEIEEEVRSLLERHGLPPMGERVRGPRVLHLGASSATPVGMA